MGLAAQIADLDRRIARLGDHIDACQADLETLGLVRLLDLHSKMMGRVTRMRQALDQMRGDDKGGLAQAIQEALDEIGQEWGIDL